jgi:hypothetical protein
MVTSGAAGDGRANVGIGEIDLGLRQRRLRLIHRRACVVVLLGGDVFLAGQRLKTLGLFLGVFILGARRG